MTDNNLIKIIKNIKLSGKYINNKTAMYIKTNEYCDNKKYIDEFIILFDNLYNRVGGLYIMGDFDLHFIVLEKYRNKGYMSRFMKSKQLRKIKPTLKEVSIVNDEDYYKIKYLLTLSGLSVKK